MKKKILIITILTIYLVNLSQAQIFGWAIQENYSDQTISKSVGVDKFGNTYISGMYLDSYHHPAPLGCFFSKYNSAGNRFWSDTIGGILFIKSVVDSSGNIFATGYFSGSVKFGSTLLTSSSYYSGFIVRYDSTGNCIFAKKTKMKGLALALSEEGTFLTSGNEGFLTKYDYTGNIIWIKNVNNSGYCAANSICIDSHNNIYIAGQFDHNVVFGSGTNSTTINYTGGFYNNFIAKFDSNGIFTWVKTPQIMYGIEKFNICTDNLDNCYFTGYFTYTIAFDTSNIYSTGNNESIITGKYNPNGTLQWSQLINGTSSNEAFDIKTDSNGNYYITGQFYGITDFGGTVVQGANDLFIAKYNSNQNLQWVLKSNGIGPYTPSAGGYALILDEKRNSIYIAGRVGNQLNFGNIAINAKSYGSALLLKIDNNILTPTEKINYENLYSLKVFPNPTHGFFQIEYVSLKKGTLQINITDANGKIVYTRVVSKFEGEFKTSVDLSKEAKGVYFIEINLGKNSEVKKIVLE